MVAPQPAETAPRRIVVVSPHLDDGVLSLGASISSWSRAGAAVELLTVLACDPDSTAAAGGWDRRGGFATEGESARARREEDRRAGSVLGATPVWLPFGSVDFERHGDEGDVRRAVSAAVDGASAVLLPGFPLSHPDHEWLMRTLATALDGHRTSFYAEQPYTRRAGTEPDLPEWVARRVRSADLRAGPHGAARPAREVVGDPVLRLAAPVARDAQEPATWPAPLRGCSRMGRLERRTNLPSGMKLVMTLLVRDEADIVDAQIAYHLGAGVDLVVATDNRSEDETTEILERYARDGVLHLIREPGDDLRQSEWVTRMARLAATDFGADWIVNADADEFWLARGATLKELFAAVPSRFGAVRGAWRNFVPRPDDERLFTERMTARLCTPSFHPHPLSTHFKSAHRGRADVRIGRGNHEALADDLVALRGWYPIEILHFPVRSYEQCRHKYVTQFVALERNAEKGIPGHMAEAYEAYRAGRLDAFYAPLVVDDEALDVGLADGTYAIDTRLRDTLRSLGFGGADESTARDGAPLRSAVEEAALFAGEYTSLGESDLGASFGDRIDDLEARLGRLEQSPAARVRRLAGSLRS